MNRRELFKQKLDAIHGELPPETRLLIVSKTRSCDEIIDYYDLGQRDFGENKVQELEKKSLELKDRCPGLRWHMIGHLQTNKIHALFSVLNLASVHSVHDQNLLDKMLKAQDRLPGELGVFLQFNTSRESEKSGFETYTELRMAAESVLASKKLKLLGLMTMGTLRTENFEAEAGRCFQELQVERIKLESEFKIKLQTSMGMSQDYTIALREKSNWIRLGTSMFQ